MLGRPTFAALIPATASVVLAGEATLGDVSVILPPPAGFCEFDASNPIDNRAITPISHVLEKSGNKLLGASADCGQLADWRLGKRQLLDDYTTYQRRIVLMDKPPTESVGQRCKIPRARGNTIVAEQLPDIKARVESVLANVKVNEMSFIGVLAEDPNACYAGLIQKIRTEAGTDKTQLTVTATSIIRNRLIYVVRHAVYQNPDTVKAVLAKLKAEVAALIAANP
jgi:hypothetical protein